MDRSDGTDRPRRGRRVREPLAVQRADTGAGAGRGGAVARLRGSRRTRDRALRRLRHGQGRRHRRHQRRPRDRDHGCAPALPERGRPLQAPDRGGGGRARQAHRARREGREGPDDQLEPPARRVDREALPGPRSLAARSDPGRDHRADPSGREVRPPQGVQVLHLRDLVDPPGRATRSREQVADDPDPGAHRRARAEDRPRRARARRRSSAGSRPTRSSRRRRSCRSSRYAR